MRESKARATHGVSISLIGFVSLSLPGQFTVVVTVNSGGVGRLNCMKITRAQPNLVSNSASNDFVKSQEGWLSGLTHQSWEAGMLAIEA